MFRFSPAAGSDSDLALKAGEIWKLCWEEQTLRRWFNAKGTRRPIEPIAHTAGEDDFTEWEWGEDAVTEVTLKVVNVAVLAPDGLQV